MHLKMFDIARHYLKTMKNIQVIKGVLSPTNDDYARYKPSLSDSRHRIAMIRLAIREPDYDWIVCDDWETQQKEWIRTLPALKHYSSVYGNNLKLLCGADLLESFLIPNLWSDEHIESILNDFGVVVIPRNGSDLRKMLYDSEKAPLFKRNIDKINIVEEFTMVDISSTMVRDAIKKGQSIDQLVHPNVARYIAKEGLYKN